jgi:hypothetical protein
VANLSQSLRDAVKKLAYGASLDQLKKRGIKQVNVLGIDRIVALVEEAVSRSLRRKLLGAERTQIADATKEEFLRLLKSNEDLTRTRDQLQQMQQDARDEIEQLRGELERQKRMLQQKLGLAAKAERPRFDGENAQVAQQLDQLFHAFVERGETNLAGLRDDALKFVLALLDRERAVASQARAAVADREIEVLERRIGKMTSALAENEARMAELARMSSADPGVASVFKEVQGLRGEEENYGKKKALMAEIFKANLALQKGISED